MTCHGQMITLPRQRPDGASCGVCGRTVPLGEKVHRVRAKLKGEVRTLVICRLHNITAEKLAWKSRGFTK